MFLITKISKLERSHFGQEFLAPEFEYLFIYQGLIIGNAYVEPEMINQVVRPFYHFGLLEKEQIEIAQPLIDAFQADIAANRSVEAKEVTNPEIYAYPNFT